MSFVSAGAIILILYLVAGFIWMTTRPQRIARKNAGHRGKDFTDMSAPTDKPSHKVEAQYTELTIRFLELERDILVFQTKFLKDMVEALEKARDAHH